MIIEVAGIVGAISTILGGLYALHRATVKPSWIFFKRIKAAIETIEGIQIELKPNGGSSLRDAINRIEVNMMFERHARRATSMILDVGVFETNKDGDCTWVNKKFSEFSGLSVDEARGYGWINGIHLDDRERITREWREAVTQARILNTQVRYVAQNNPFTSDGESVTTKAAVHALPVLDSKDRLLGYVGIVSPAK